MDRYAATVLILIKTIHTLVWGVFAGAIVVLPWFIAKRRWRWVAWLGGLVALECMVVAVNGMRCPLTDVAAQYTTDRVDNFDIYLPVWLARWNKAIFGTMYAAEVVWAASIWARAEIAERQRTQRAQIEVPLSGPQFPKAESVKNDDGRRVMTGDPASTIALIKVESDDQSGEGAR